MKTENTLRMAKNSLLCFFMALGAGFLVACGGGGGGSVTPQEFPVYLVDAAVEGVEYSGPVGDGLTGKGGVFLANEGEFVFSIGATTLGSVRLNSDWANNEVAPSDFIGVDDARVIDIARILQGLDGDAGPGISISQSVRENAHDLFGDIDGMEGRVNVKIANIVDTFPIPAKSGADSATDHLTATRRCLFSGGYVGSYRATLHSGGEAPLDEGQVYYAVEPFANGAKRVEFSNVQEENNFVLRSFDDTYTVGVIGSTITLSPGNELSFVTPRLVTGIWQNTNTDGDVTVSGTHRLELAAGHPGASRRIVGVETTDDAGTAAGLYVLDHFESDGNFRGQYYDMGTDGVSVLALSLAIATDGVSWPTGNGTSMLILSGTRGEGATTITMEIVRTDNNYGTFEEVGNDNLSGTWCDIGGAVGSAVAPTPSPRTPPAPSASAQSDTMIEVTWSAAPRATLYKLYRSESNGPDLQVGGDISALRYLDIGRTAETEYFYRLEACNSGGCSGRSPKVSATTPVGPCRVGQVLVPGKSCTYIEHTISVSSGLGGLSEISLDPPPEIGTGTFTRDPRGLDVTYTLTDRTTGAVLGIIIIRNTGENNEWRIRSRT